MKTFIYTKKAKKARYGLKVTLNIFQIENNTPRFICDTEFSSGSTPGDVTEAMHALANKGAIDSQFSKGYYQYNHVDFQIIELF